MEEHVLCAVVLVVVAVDAMVVLLVIRAVVLVDGVHVPPREVALVEPQLAVQLIARLYETVAQVAVDFLGGHMQPVVLILHPASFVAGIHAHLNVLAFVGLQQGAPLQGVYHHLAVLASRHHGLAFTLEAHHTGLGRRVVEHKIERSDIRGHHHVLIIGEDGCLLLQGVEGGRHLHSILAGGHQAQCRQTQAQHGLSLV